MAKKCTKTKILYHLIYLIGIILSVICSIFMFPQVFWRFIDSLIDLGDSFLYYVLKLRYYYFDIEIDRDPKIIQIPDSAFALLPWTWEEFCARIVDFFPTFFSEENLSAYLSALGDVLWVMSIYFTFVFPLFILILLLLLLDINNGGESSKKRKISQPLRVCLAVSNVTVRPIRKFIARFIEDMNDGEKKYRYYRNIIIAIWLYNLNIITIAIEAVAFFIYFSASFDFLNIYTQFVKMLFDVSVAFSTFPIWLQCIIGYIVFVIIRKIIANAGRSHREEKNEEFVKSLSLICLIVGTTGSKKTTLMSDITLTKEVELRKRALSSMEENELKFPDFPWANVRNFIDQAERRHALYSLASISRFYDLLRAGSKIKNDYKDNVRRRLRKKYGYNYSNYFFDYDIRLNSKFDNSLYIDELLDVIENYSKEYWFYRLPSSIVVGNIPVRSRIKWKKGTQYPVADFDFFKRKSKNLKKESQYSHILDQDFFRIEKQRKNNNPQAGAFEVGIVNFDEWAKERGNQVTNRRYSISDEEANPLNDGMNMDLKTRRQASVIEHDPYLFMIGTEQRPSSLQADELDLCDIIYASEDYKEKIGIPFYNTTLLLNEFFKLIYESYNKIRREKSSDYTLINYLITHIYRFWWKIILRNKNEYGYYQGEISRQLPGVDGKLVKGKYYLQFKKIYSKTFATAVLNCFYQKKADLCVVGINDLPVYTDIYQDIDDMREQNSYYYDLLLKSFGYDGEKDNQYDYKKERDSQMLKTIYDSNKRISKLEEFNYKQNLQIVELQNKLKEKNEKK